MRVVTWNVNGIRAASKNNSWSKLWEHDFDVFCLQEIKAFPEQLEFWLREPDGFRSWWHPAEKPGYSGVAIYSRKEPLDVQYGIGIPEIDREGRVISARFKDVRVISAYFPNSQRDHARLPYKLEFCKQILAYCHALKAKGENLILCGDFNIAHREIDLRNPKANENNAGFLPQERQWMEQFLSQGYVDAFRHFIKDPLHYTWWSYRPGVRDRNIGWRIDYHVTNCEYADRLDDVKHMYDILGSDHCPVLLDVKD